MKTREIQEINLNPIRFAGEYQEPTTTSLDLLRLFPYGVHMSSDGMQPLLFLKDEKGENNMPVMINPLEAGIILAQFNRSLAPATPHRALATLLEKMNVHLEKCIFDKIKTNAQWVKLIGNQHDVFELHLKAEDAMSLCLFLELPIFASPTYISKSRTLTTQMEGVSKEVKLNPQVLTSRQTYIM